MLDVFRVKIHTIVVTNPHRNSGGKGTLNEKNIKTLLEREGMTCNEALRRESVTDMDWILDFTTV